MFLARAPGSEHPFPFVRLSHLMKELKKLRWFLSGFELEGANGQKGATLVVKWHIFPRRRCRKMATCGNFWENWHKWHIFSAAGAENFDNLGILVKWPITAVFQNSPPSYVVFCRALLSSPELAKLRRSLPSSTLIRRSARISVELQDYLFLNLHLFWALHYGCTHSMCSIFVPLLRAPPLINCYQLVSGVRWLGRQQ